MVEPYDIKIESQLTGDWGFSKAKYYDYENARLFPRIKEYRRWMVIQWLIGKLSTTEYVEARNNYQCYREFINKK